MARPRKCRICGYRFRDNEDICPECFTARDDDISCEQFGRDEHSHDAGFSTTESSDVYREFSEKSFVDEQRKEEANDPIPSATYGGKQGTPPPTYAQQSYTSRGAAPNNFYQGMQSRQDKLNALKNASNANAGGNVNYSNVYYGNRGAQGIPQGDGRRVYYTAAGTPKKTNGAVVAVVVIIFLSIFFVPFIMGIISSFNSSTNKSRTTTAPAKKGLDISYTMPDLSLPNISVPDVDDIDIRQATLKGGSYDLIARRIETGKRYSPDELMNNFSDKEIKTHRVENDYLPEGYRVLIMDMISTSTDINNPKSPEIVAKGCFIETFDDKGHLICTSYPLGEMETASRIDDISFLIPSEYYSFTLHILLNEKSSSGAGNDANYKTINIGKFNVYASDDHADDSTKTEKDTSTVSKKDKSA